MSEIISKHIIETLATKVSDKVCIRIGDALQKVGILMIIPSVVLLGIGLIKKSYLY